MASSTKSPGTVTQSAISGAAQWDNPTLVSASDDLRAIANLVDSPGGGSVVTTYRLLLSNFGFAIPFGSVVTGFALNFEGCGLIIYPEPLQSVNDGTVDLSDGTNVVGQNSDVAQWSPPSIVVLDSTRAIPSAGASTDNWGWTNPVVDTINSEDFTVRYYATCSNSVSPHIDHLSLTVYYTELNAAQYTMSGGAGAGGTFPRGVRYPFRGGAGAGGTFPKGTRFPTRGGAGTGGTFPTATGKGFSMTGGAGAGGTIRMNGVGFRTSGGAGGGGQWPRGVGVRTSGGSGAGGTTPYLQQVSKTTTGGAGGGGNMNGSSGRGYATTGGAGAGGTIRVGPRGVRWTTKGGVGASSVTGMGPKAATRSTSGGAGVGGGFVAYGTINGFPVGENYVRTHRGPVTRRLLYESLRKKVATILNENFVYIAFDEPDMNSLPSHESFVVIVVGAVQDDQAILAGGGQYTPARVDTARIRCYSKSTTDWTPRATDWNLMQGRGSMERARALRRRLHMLDLQDQGGWLILSEPMRSLTTMAPTQRRATPQYGYYEEAFEMRWQEWLGN